MIINISKPKFESIASRNELDLPKRWDGADFHSSLGALYEKYCSILSEYINAKDLTKVRTICDDILKCIEYYYDGFPNRAFQQMDHVMKKLVRHLLIVYPKTG